MLLVPAVIQFLLATPGVDTTDFSSLRAIVYGASPITDDVLVKGLERFGCEFVQVYGLTETTGSMAQLDEHDHDPATPELLRSCGKPYPWVGGADRRRRRAPTSRPARSARCGPGRRRTCSATGTTPKRRRRRSPPTAG